MDLSKCTEEVILSIEQAQNLIQLRRNCLNLAQILQFDGFYYLQQTSQKNASHSKTVSIFSVSNDFNVQYIEAIFNQCHFKGFPIIWSDLEHQSIPLHTYYDGISSVSYVPNGTVGMFSLLINKDKNNRSIEMIRNHMLFITSIVTMSAYRITGEIENSKNQYRNLFSQREISCLQFTAEGKTSEEISAILHISTRTVNHHLYSAIEKLGVNNRTQAIAKALSLRLINYNEENI